MKEIAGYEKEKKELDSLREMLHDIKRYRDLGIRIPRGLLLYGEPGVGKTIMARSIADERINLVELRAADCCEDEKDIAIREAFNKAKENAPSVLLLDELDKIAGTSRHFYMEGNDDVKKILLQELDKLTDDDAVLVVATCNIVECIGNTLLRAGRFDRQMEIKKPDEDTRKKIVKLYFDKLKIKRNINIEYLAKIMHGCTGAEIECIINEAAIYATENNKKGINIDAIRKVMNKIAFDGSECQPLEDEEERKKIATHEAGHAIVALALIPNNIYGVTILPQGNSGGHVQIIHEENKLVASDDIKSEIAVLLAGRVAERTVLGKTYLGSEADLSRAKTLAVNLLTKHAIGGYKLLMKSVPHDFEDGNASEECQSELDREFERLMNQSDRVAEYIIRNNKEVFDEIVNALMDKQMMSRDELLAYKDKIQTRDNLPENMEKAISKEELIETIKSDLIVNVLDFIDKNKTVSVSMVQKEFCIGYNRACKIVEALEYFGVVTSKQETGKRSQLLNKEEALGKINKYLDDNNKDNSYKIKNNGMPEHNATIKREQLNFNVNLDS